MKDKFDKLIRITFLQLLVCFAVVVGCVTIKNVFPDVSQYLKESLVSLIDENVDYVDIFNDIGEAVTGDDGVIDVFGKFVDAFSEQAVVESGTQGDVIIISESKRV